MDSAALNVKRPRLEGAIHKRAPQRPTAVPSEIYIAHKSKTCVIVRRAKDLLMNKRFKKVTLHGMGASITKTVITAQAIASALHHHVRLRTTTSTVQLVDDIVPEDMDEDLSTQTRMNSAIHIEITPTSGLADLQKLAGAVVRKPSRVTKKET